MTDDEILEIVRPHLDAGDGGYLCDLGSEYVVRACRALLSCDAADNESLRKDAARYRWLRNTDCWEDEIYKIPLKDRPEFLWIASSRDEVTNNDGENLDAAIDHLMTVTHQGVVS